MLRGICAVFSILPKLESVILNFKMVSDIDIRTLRDIPTPIFEDIWTIFAIAHKSEDVILHFKMALVNDLWTLLRIQNN